MRESIIAAMPLPDDLDCLSPAELKGLVVQQREQIVELHRLVAALRDGIAWLKAARGGRVRHKATNELLHADGKCFGS